MSGGEKKPYDAEVDYFYSSNDYFVTDIKPTDKTRIECTIRPGTAHSSFSAFFGSRRDITVDYFTVMQEGLRAFIGTGVEYVRFENAYSYEEFRDITYSAGYFKIGSTVYRDVSVSSFACTNNIGILCLNSGEFQAIGHIGKRFRIYEDDVLLKDYIAVLNTFDTNQEVCLYNQLSENSEPEFLRSKFKRVNYGMLNN